MAEVQLTIILRCRMITYNVVVAAQLAPPTYTSHTHNHPLMLVKCRYYAMCKITLTHTHTIHPCCMHSSCHVWSGSGLEFMLHIISSSMLFDGCEDPTDGRAAH